MGFYGFLLAKTWDLTISVSESTRDDRINDLLIMNSLVSSGDTLNT